MRGDGGTTTVGFLEEFKRGCEGDDSQHYRVAGIQVTCSHCGAQDFDAGRALLNTTGMTLLGLDWANREASLLVCTTCGRIEWFLEEPERI